jgi:hypothetical protein
MALVDAQTAKNDRPRHSGKINFASGLFVETGEMIDMFGRPTN